MTAKRAAVSSDPVASEAAIATFERGGGAADAVVSGYAALAGAHAAALFAPAVALVAGVGAGHRVFDGRARQPGRGAARPRGHRLGEAVPLAARVAAPRTVAALCALHARFGRLSLRELWTMGAAVARRCEAPARATLLDAIADQGAAALRRSAFVTTVERAAGIVAGGTLTEEDLLESGALELDASVRTSAAGLTLVTAPHPPGPKRPCQVVLATDGWGLTAALSLSPSLDVVDVEELGVSLSTDADPVLRGVQRTAPGAPRDVAHAVALGEGPAGLRFAVAGLDSAPLDAEGFAALSLRELVPVERALRSLTAGATSWLAVLADGREARVVSSVPAA